MPRKKSKVIKSLFIVWIIFLIIAIGTPIAAFNLQTTIAPSTEFGSIDYVVDSPYVLKAGTEKSFSSIGEDAERAQSYLGEMVEYANGIVDNVYGYGIFRTPVVFDAETVDDVTEQMIRVNDGLSEESQSEVKIAEAFPNKIFSDELITEINANNYEIDNFVTIAEELESSFHRWCNGISTLVDNGFIEDADDVANWLQWCNDAPDNIVEKDGSEYKINLWDIEFTDKIFASECEERVVQDCDPDGNNCEEFHFTVCEVTHVGTEVATLRFSDLDIRLFEKASDIFIAVNEKGVDEAKSITGKFDFEQYGFEVEHEGSVDGVQALEHAAGFYLITNDVDIIAASEGNIDKQSSLTNVWRGVETGRIFDSPSSLIAFGVTAISWGIVIILGLTLVMMLILRRR